MPNSSSRSATLAPAVASNLDFNVGLLKHVWLVISNTGDSNAIDTTAVSVSPHGTSFGTLTPIGTAVGSIDALGVSGVISMPVSGTTLRVALTSTSGSTATVELYGSEEAFADGVIRVNGNAVGALNTGALSVTDITASGDLAVGGDAEVTGATTLDDLTAATATVSALTAGRVVIAGTDGLLADDGDLTFATATLTATNMVVTTALTQGAAGSMAAGSGGISTTGDLNAVGGFRTLVGPFVQTNVAADQSAVQIALGATGTVHLDVAMPRAGSLVGIVASFTVAPAGSSLVVSVLKNGSLIDAAGILTVTAGATLGRATTFTKDTAGLTFVAGDRIGIAVTTDGSWTATTSDITAFAWVEC